jgi:hypothetical protein
VTKGAIAVAAIPIDVTGALQALVVRPIELWDAWLFAEAEATLALATWNRASSDDRARAYAVYAAALDREEQAGLVLALYVGERPVATNSS